MLLFLFDMCDGQQQVCMQGGELKFYKTYKYICIQNAQVQPASILLTASQVESYCCSDIKGAFPS